MNIKEIMENNPDGFTVDFKTGNPIRQGYAVALTNWTAEDWEKPETLMAVNNIQNKFGSGFQYTLGGWKEGNTYYLDFGIIVYTLEEAKRIGREYGQKAIYNLDTSQTIYI